MTSDNKYINLAGLNSYHLQLKKSFLDTIGTNTTSITSLEAGQDATADSLGRHLSDDAAHSNNKYSAGDGLVKDTTGDSAGTFMVNFGGTGVEKTVSRSDHTHNYAGASSAGGVATEASKVSNKLTINGSEYDGSAAVPITIPYIDAVEVNPRKVESGATLTSSTDLNALTNSTKKLIINLDVPKGDTGAQGPKGDTGTISVGSVTKGTTASVTNKGTSTAAVFDFVLPKGDKGDTGTISIGSVTKGTDASVTNSGSSTAAKFDFVLPKGDKGDTLIATSQKTIRKVLTGNDRSVNIPNYSTYNMYLVYKNGFLLSGDNAPLASGYHYNITSKGVINFTDKIVNSNGDEIDIVVTENTDCSKITAASTAATTSDVASAKSDAIAQISQLSVLLSGSVMGDTAQIKRAGSSKSWYQGRDGAPFVMNTAGDYSPILSAKTSDGSWDLGPYTSSANAMYLSYITDANYNSGTNVTTCQYKFDKNGTLTAPAVYGAYWNDLADSIEVPDDTIIEPGYCYCFDGENYYKSTKYLDEGIMGIHSDTYGFSMGKKNRSKEIDIATSGFVLAYVDKKYKPGTPLTCGKEGTLTEISLKDKRDYPERIVGTFWKPEPLKEWGPENRKIEVNGRCWIKIK